MPSPVTNATAGMTRSRESVAVVIVESTHTLETAMQILSTRFRRVVGLIALLLAVPPAAANAQGMYNPANEGGSLPQHGSFSLLPWEAIDDYSGNVMLVSPDFVLPANAGINLVVRRVYNSKDRVWRFDSRHAAPLLCQRHLAGRHQRRRLDVLAAPGRIQPRPLLHDVVLALQGVDPRSGISCRDQV